MAGPLHGIKVLDFTIAQQGAYATLLLAEMGAEVIKVEPPGRGELGREVARDRQTKFSYFFLAMNRGKKGITIDLKAEKGRRLVLDLARYCDVVVENFRPGVMERLGLGYEDFRAVNPGIIYASASAFGTRGPWSHLPGNDLLGQATSGLMSVTGEEGQGPLPAGVAIADHTGAVTLALGIVAALLARERTGQGQKVETSLLGSMLAAQSWELTYYLNTGEPVRKAGRGHALVPHLWRVYKTSDGYLALGGVAVERWPQFCRAIGRPELIDDPSFAHLGHRLRHMDALHQLLEEHFARAPTEEWLARLEEADVPTAPVLDYQAVAHERHMYEGEYLVRVPHRRLGQVTMVNFPIRFSATPGAIRGPEPELGEHTEEILRSYPGLSPQEIEELRREGVI